MTRRPLRIHPSRRRRRAFFSRGQLSSEGLEPRLLLAWSGPSEPPAIDATSFFAQRISSESLLVRAATQEFVAGELIVAVDVPIGKDRLPTFLNALSWDTRLGIEGPITARPLLQFEPQLGRTYAVVQLELGTGSTLDALPRLEKDPFVLWSSPNFVYPIDPREFTPDDPQFANQYAHALSQTNLAWDITLGASSVVIAVTDDGIDLDHEDLAANIWQNVAEIPNNGIDDDANGYIDDVSGWDFVDADNDANPNGVDRHGTHVAGIAAAVTDNAKGVAGVAGGSTILPLKIYDGQQPAAWTSAVVAEAFAYAADNGADIVTTSYNIDPFVGDPVFTAGLQYLYDAGALHFNSAGNTNSKNPPRQFFEQTILVANTNQYDQKHSSSNYGDGIDLAAPGVQIVSTVPGSAYASFTGSSMAAPNAAGAAALIWSANPTWTRDQVVAQLLATADNIDWLNPNHAGQLGAGRVNPYRALTEALGPPALEQVTGLPAHGTSAESLSIDEFSLAFSQYMDSESINQLSGVELRSAGLDGQFETPDDGIIGLALAEPYMVGSNSARIAMTDGPLGLGDYQLRLAASQLTNPFGTELDGDLDGLAGGDVIITFTVSPPPPVPRLPLGGLVYESELFGSVTSANEVDPYFVSLAADSIFSVRVRGNGGLVPQIELFDPAGSSLGITAAEGNTVLVPAITATMTGDYAIRVRGDAGSTGSYGIELFQHAQSEMEQEGAGTNNQPLAAEALALSGEAWGGQTARRMAAVGELSANDEDWFSFSLEDGERASITAGSGTELNVELYSASGELLATATENSAGVYVTAWQDPTGDGFADDYFVRLAEGAGKYTLVVIQDAEFELETGTEQGATGQVLMSSAVFGFVAEHANGRAEPDEQPQGTLVDTAFQGVTLSNSTGGHVFVDQASFQAPTGNLVFAPYVGGAGGWTELSRELRVDFDAPTHLVSIDVGSDDLSDVGFLRAYDSQGQLIAEVVSSALPRDAFETLTILRPRADIAYVTAAGLGADVTPLDNLRFGNPGGSDVYAIDANAGDMLDITVYLPGEGPGDIANGLDTPSGRQISMEVFDPAGMSLGTAADVIQQVATETGRYTLVVSALSGQGEYFLEVIGATGNDLPPSVVSASLANEARVVGFPASIQFDFSEVISAASLQGNELLVNGVPALFAHLVDADSIEFILDPLSYAGRGPQQLWLPADTLADVDGRGNLGFGMTLIVDELLPFARLGILGSLAAASRGNQITLTPTELVDSVSFDISAGERVVAAIFPQNELATLTVSVSGSSEAVTAAAPGAPIYLPAVSFAEDAELVLQVSSDLPTSATLDVYRNTDLFASDATSPAMLSGGLPVAGGFRYSAIAELPTSPTPMYEFLVLPPTEPVTSVDILLAGIDAELSPALTLEILDDQGVVTATADISTDGQFERSFLGLDWAAGEPYRLRVIGEEGEAFQLVVLANAVIETEPNGASDPPRELFRRPDASAAAIGFLTAADVDGFSLDLATGEVLSLRTLTFADGDHADPINSLDPHLRLFHPGGWEAAFDANGLDGKNAFLEFMASEPGTYRIEIAAESGSGEYGLLASVIPVPVVTGDFDGDGNWNCQDIDLLVAFLAGGGMDLGFDLNNDGSIDLLDRDAWLQVAASQNGLTASYLVGDANLDGVVDTSDFNVWNVHKFTASAAWCSGDFNADGLVDTSDFNLWNINKYSQAGSSSAATAGVTTPPRQTEPFPRGQTPTPPLPPPPTASFRRESPAKNRPLRWLVEDSTEQQPRLMITDWLLANTQW